MGTAVSQPWTGTAAAFSAAASTISATATCARAGKSATAFRAQHRPCQGCATAVAPLRSELNHPCPGRG